MNPHILIVGRKTWAGYHKPYLEAVRGAGGEPEMDFPDIETAKNEGALKEFLRPFQGILLPGGVDIDPGRYRESPHEKLGRIDRELDEAQLAVVRYVMNERIPMLAICRGLQVMGVAVGAALYQDLPSQRPSDVDHNIREPKNRLAHPVIVEEASRLARVCGSTRFDVNSRHHQAIRENDTSKIIGPFQIVARAPDRIIEGVESPSHAFLIAVQWHPENLVDDNAHAQGLFRGFIEACGAMRIPRSG